jgi:hypothetical protein
MKNSISSADEQKPIVVSIRLRGEYQAPKVDTEIASMMMKSNCTCDAKSGSGTEGPETCACTSRVGTGAG